MPKIKYRGRLTKTERSTLLDIVSRGSASDRSIMRANVLLTADENNSKGKKSETEIAELYNVHQQTVHTVRKEHSQKGLEATVHGRFRLQMADPGGESAATEPDAGSMI